MDPQSITVVILAEREGTPLGAGWLLQSGKVLTCYHVVEGHQNILVRAADLSSEALPYEVSHFLPKKVVGSGNAAAYDDDLALLEGVRESLNPLSWAPSGAVSPGLEVSGYGFPDAVAGGGAGQSGCGVTSSKNGVGRYEVLDPPVGEHAMQLGFSGCPVVNVLTRKVIGLLSSDRDEAKRALVVPAAKLAAWLEALGISEPELQVLEDAQLRRLEGIAKKVFRPHGKVPAQPFDQRVRLRAHDGADGERQAFRSTEYVGAKDLVPFVFAAEIMKDGSQALVVADGGMGKSTFMYHVAEQLERARTDYVWLDVIGIEKVSEDGDFLDWDEAVLIPKLFKSNRVGPANVGDPFNRESHLVVFADGLNELGSAARANKLLAILCGYVGRNNNVSLLASTRRSANFEKHESLKVFDILPIAPTEVALAIGRDAATIKPEALELLSQPQILRIAQEIGDYSPTSASNIYEKYFNKILGDFFSKSGDNSDKKIVPVLDVLSRFSFDYLKEHLSLKKITRSKWDDDLAEAIKRDSLGLDGIRLTGHLLDDGLLTQSGEADVPEIAFQHSLFVEWLAARHFCGLEEAEWTSSGFDAISIDDSSKDNLLLAIELVAEERVEQFLICMYDWRWQHVLDLAAGDPGGLSENLRDAFLGLNAMRLHDPFIHTQTSTKEAIKKQAERGNRFAGKLLETKSEEGVLEVLRERFPENKDYDDHPTITPWHRLLWSKEKQGSRLNLIADPNPYLGWSASNLLRHFRIDRADTSSAMLAYQASFETAIAARKDDEMPGEGLRWRIVHMLGKAPESELTNDVVSWLIVVWRNHREHRDVRFGACRSLMELALERAEVREDVFGQMTETLDDWANSTEESEMWRSDAERAAKQIWRASEPRLSDAELNDWNRALRSVMKAAERCGRALHWKLDDINNSLMKIGGME